MSVLLGAIFFMLIQVGVKNGASKGWSIAAGVITGDIIFVILAISFTSYISDFLKAHEGKASVVGATVFLLMGVATFLKKREPIEEEAQISRSKHARDFYIKPFVINLLNPANAAWWLGLYSIPPAVDYQFAQKIAFAFGAVATVFFTEVGVAYTAAALKRFISPVILKRIDMVVGLVLILVALRMYARAAGWF